MACHGGLTFVSQWFDKCVRVFDEAAGAFGEAHAIPGGSGYLAMLSAHEGRVLVTDDEKGCVHVFDMELVGAPI